MRTLPPISAARVESIAVGVLLCLVLLVRAHASDTISATAHVTSAGGVEASAPMRVVIDRLSNEHERDELLTAIRKGGTPAARNLLQARNSLGSVQVGATVTAIKFVYATTTGDGQLITAVTGSPIAFVGAGKPNAGSKQGFDLGLVLLQLPAAGPGLGELVPAAKVRVNDQGGIVTEDYSSETVRLVNVVSSSE